MRQKVGIKQMLADEAARFSPQQIADMFEQVKRHSVQNDIELDWSTLRLQVGAGMMPGALEFRLEMEGWSDETPEPSAPGHDS